MVMFLSTMMFSDNELVIIWFALLTEQRKQEEGSQRWFRYEHMLRNIEERVGATKRPHLTVINTNNEKGKSE